MTLKHWGQHTETGIICVLPVGIVYYECPRLANPAELKTQYISIGVCSIYSNAYAVYIQPRMQYIFIFQDYILAVGGHSFCLICIRRGGRFEQLLFQPFTYWQVVEAVSSVCYHNSKQESADSYEYVCACGGIFVAVCPCHLHINKRVMGDV